MTRPRAVVAFYAAWCGPCQRELPELVEHVAGLADLFVVVSADESVEDTRRQIDNLGLPELRFLVDGSEALFTEGKVTSLPTTFLISDSGTVLRRFDGFSSLHVQRLKAQLERSSQDDAKRTP